VGVGHQTADRRYFARSFLLGDFPIAFAFAKGYPFIV